MNGGASKSLQLMLVSDVLVTYYVQTRLVMTTGGLDQLFFPEQPRSLFFKKKRKEKKGKAI